VLLELTVDVELDVKLDVQLELSGVGSPNGHQSRPSTCIFFPYRNRVGPSENV
jgi:hypothetical protein